MAVKEIVEATDANAKEVNLCCTDPCKCSTEQCTNRYSHEQSDFSDEDSDQSMNLHILVIICRLQNRQFTLKIH